MTTEAGRQLLDRHVDCEGVCEVWVEREAIAAIEAEAVEQERARIREERARLRAVVELLARAMETIEGLVVQYAPWDHGVGGFQTGGLSALQDAFDALGWDDPHPYPAGRCEEPGCMRQRSCGMPAPDGYRWLCGEHYRLVEEATR